MKMKSAAILLPLLTCMLFLGGCVGAVNITSPDQIDPDESLVIVKIVRGDFHAPRPLLAPIGEMYPARKKLELPDSSSSGYYICEAVKPGVYTLCTYEYDAPSDRYRRENMLFFTVPGGALIDLGELRINKSGRTRGRSYRGEFYETAPYRFSLRELAGRNNLSCLSAHHPEVFSQFSGKAHHPEITRY